MTKDQLVSRAVRVLVPLAAALIWTIVAAAIAPGQVRPGAARNQGPKAMPVVLGISPKAAPPGGTGEVVLTGRNFFPGLSFQITGVQIESFKVESPERAVASIYVPENTQEGVCDLTLEWWYTAKGEISPSPLGTPEVAQIPKYITFTISNSAPMTILLGKYTLFPEEEISIMKSEAATGQQMQRSAQANQLSKDQQQQMQKQGDDMKAIQEKYKRGEITQAEYMAAAMKAASSMMGQLTPQQKAAMGQQMTATSQARETSNKLTELQKQEKKVELRLNQGSITFLDGKNPLYTEKVSALKEITVVPPLSSKNRSAEFQMAFSSGKKYSFRCERDDADNVVSKLKKRLGK